MVERVRINRNIQARELRVIGADGANLGILGLEAALEEARSAGLDLIEISAKAVPPIARIMDYGKFQYEANKKLKAAKAKQHTVEVKSLQIKIGTGEHDLDLKAKKASEWLQEGNKIKIELFLTGRSKFLDFNFLKERLERVLRLISVPYKVSEEPKKGPKGLAILIEKE